VRVWKAIRDYFELTAWYLVVLDLLRVSAACAAFMLARPWLEAFIQRPSVQAGLHRAIFTRADFATARMLYGGMVTVGATLTTFWVLTALRHGVRMTVLRYQPTDRKRLEMAQEKESLPAYPFNPEAFALVLGELQDRDGSRVPNPASPELHPRWLTLPERALYTGFFITGGIGSGKTTGVADPCLEQLLRMERKIRVRAGGREYDDRYVFSGLVLDEKGDFCTLTRKKMEALGRGKDFIRIAPGGDVLWNVIYNPSIPTWAVGYQLASILSKFNKGARGSDPFWDQAPRELTTDYLTLIDDAMGYYTLADYLQVLVSSKLQDELHDMARERHRTNLGRISEIERRWARISNRREEMSEGLRGSLQACAKAGLNLFEFPEMRESFCPRKEDYFTGPCCPWPERKARTEAEEAILAREHTDGILLPRENVFAGFDAILDRGIVVGLDMPKTVWFDAASFVQVALKAQWQEAVLRRDARASNGELLVPPRLGLGVGYCPTFLMADEAQANVVPSDQEFLAQCRSKRASCWWLTQSHKSIIGAVGPDKKADAEAFFQNNMTRIYLRQSDIESMEMIGKEVGNKDVSKISVAVTEGGQQSRVSYFHNQFVNEALGVSETKTAAIEEKPFFEIEELRTMPNFVSVVLPSTGDETLPATKLFLRPTFLFGSDSNLRRETSWFDWPDELKKRVTLATVDQAPTWTAPEGVVDLEGLHTFSGGFLNIRVPAEPYAAGLTTPSASEAAVALEERKADTLGEAPERRVTAGQATETPTAQEIRGVLSVPVRVAAEEIAQGSVGELAEEAEVLTAHSPEQPAPLDMPW
jgi:hypothetical protein